MSISVLGFKDLKLFLISHNNTLTNVIIKLVDLLFLKIYFSVCKLPYNPLFVTCNTSSTFKYTHEEKIRNGYYVNRGKHGLTQKDFNITKTARGINIELGQKLKVQIMINNV